MDRSSSRAQNYRRSQESDEDAQLRPDEKPIGKAKPNPRLRGSHKKLRGVRKGRKHRRL